MNQDTKPKRQIWTLLALTVAGGCVGFLLARVGLAAAKSLPAGVVPSLFLLVFPLFFIAVAFHEAGHAFMGIRMGFDFRLFVVGPFLWERQDDGWKFKWNTNVNVAGGMALCVPRPSADLTRRFGWFVAGGPLGSLVLALVAWAIFLLVDSLQPTSAVGLVFTYLWPLLAILSALLFVISLLPMHTGGFSSDGARLLRLSRGGDAAKFDFLMVTYVSRSIAGIRAGAFDTEDLLAARELGEKINAPMKLYIDYYLFHAYFDRREYEKAESYLQHYLDNVEAIPEGMRGSAWLDAAFFYAVAFEDREKAMFYWNKYKPSALVPKAKALACEAVLALLHQQTDKALALVDQANAEWPHMLEKGIANALSDQLNTLKKNRLTIHESFPS